MANFFIYLEKVLNNVEFFNNKNILDKIDTKFSKPQINKKFSEIKDMRIDKGDVFYYYQKEINPTFNFKIGTTLYELVFVTEYDQSLIKLGDKLSIIGSKKEIDPKVAGRYGIAFYPKKNVQDKYGNISLKPQDSIKLFDYLRTCAEKVNNKKFYFDGAFTDKEKIVLNKIKKFSDEMIKNKEVKKYEEMENIFLTALSEAMIALKTDIIEKIKSIIKKNINNFDKMLKKIAFIIRDELGINFNVREQHFVKLLAKEGIKARIGNKYTRTIFFELP